MGYTPDEMLNIFKEYGKEIKYFDIKNLFKGIIDIVIKKKLTIDGLNSGNKLENIIKKACINNIEVWKAVRASCSYPGVFSPYKYKSTELVDGGIRENIPWKQLKEIGVDKVISVIFSKKIKNKKEKNIIDVIDGSLDILCHELSIYELNGVDSLINISTEDISLLDVKKIEELYNIGYVITKEYIEDKK